MKKTSDTPDTSYFIPWRPEMIYQVEPSLKAVAERAIAHNRGEFYERIDAYRKAKCEAEKLVGWCARDPRLRSSDAWDCFFDCILERLEL